MTAMEARLQMTTSMPAAPDQLHTLTRPPKVPQHTRLLEILPDMMPEDYVCVGVETQRGNGTQMWVHKEDTRDFVLFKMAPENQGGRPAQAAGQLHALTRGSVFPGSAAALHFGHFFENPRQVPKWYQHLTYGFHDTEVWGTLH